MEILGSALLLAYWFCSMDPTLISHHFTLTKSRKRSEILKANTLPTFFELEATDDRLGIMSAEDNRQF